VRDSGPRTTASRDFEWHEGETFIGNPSCIWRRESQRECDRQFGAVPYARASSECTFGQVSEATPLTPPQSPCHVLTAGSIRINWRPRDHCSGDHQRDAGPEQREPCRADRRQSCSAWAAIHVYSARAPGRLPSAEEFGEIIVRAKASCALKDVARVELGAQNYNMIGRLNGKPAALIAVYQAPGANAVASAARVRALMLELGWLCRTN
jgi:hypothetical protein